MAPSRPSKRDRPLPSIPLAVISKTEPFATAPSVPESIRTVLEQVWPEVQNRLVQLEPQTPHIFAAGSDRRPVDRLVDKLWVAQGGTNKIIAVSFR